MNRLEKRKLKTNLYKHGNTIMYAMIFVMASIITIAAAAGRGDGAEYIDESKIASVEETVDVKNKDTQKVAVSEASEDNTEPNTTETDTEAQTTKAEPQQTTVSKVKITADTLNVRAEASQEAEILGMADKDDVFEVIAQTGEWIEINFNGNNGFVKAEFTEAQ